MLRTSDFDYPLDEELIAQAPAQRRDESRLMLLRRSDANLSHHAFGELPEMLRAGDLLVLNDTRVVPAKFACRRTTGGRVDGLFCHECHQPPGRWEVLLRNAGRCKAGEKLDLERSDGTQIVLEKDLGKGRWLVEVRPQAPARQILAQAGTTPLPPYIRRAGLGQDGTDRTRYQTVYAARDGAIAAPTAGLHFTEELLGRLRAAGILTTTVTLHVGPGTFLPVKTDDPAVHEMHSEWYDLPPETAKTLNAARREGRRVVAVGTTAVRVLETIAAQGEHRTQDEPFAPASGWTDIFLYPPAPFRAVDALITNFHLPKSTLLMLVAAFCAPGSTAGLEMILQTYAQAVRQRYRFYSYGDAMLIE